MSKDIYLVINILDELNNKYRQKKDVHSETKTQHPQKLNDKDHQGNHIGTIKTVLHK